jgi:hypothetical protein
MMGLWNKLARPQERNAPFRLMCIAIAETREGLAHIALRSSARARPRVSSISFARQTTPWSRGWVWVRRVAVALRRGRFGLPAA